MARVFYPIMANSALWLLANLTITVNSDLLKYDKNNSENMVNLMETSSEPLVPSRSLPTDEPCFYGVLSENGTIAWNYQDKNRVSTPVALDQKFVYFNYTNSKNEPSTRLVALHWENDTHCGGYCYQEKEYRTFLKERMTLIVSVNGHTV